MPHGVGPTGPLDELIKRWRFEARQNDGIDDARWNALTDCANELEAALLRRQQTMTWAKNQPPYLPLPAFVNERETISCWSLTWRERLCVLWSGRLWLRQMNFGQSLQPQAPCVESPFVEPVA